MDNVIFFIGGVRIINGSKVIKISIVDDELVFDCGKGIYNPKVKFADNNRVKLFMDRMVDRLSKLPVHHRLIVCINDDDINSNKEEGDTNETYTDEINDIDAC